YHISKNLTLNLGVRISLYGTFWERNHLISNWFPSAYDPTTAPRLQVNDTPDIPQGAIIPGSGDPFDGTVQCGVNGIPRGCLKGHLFNPAPRLGFSWDPLGNGKMAVRGGYGIFFEHTNGLEANAEDLEGTPPIVETPTQYNISGYANVGGQGLLFPLSTTSIPDHAVWPYVQQWHLDLQREFIRHTVATIAYVGAKGTHLTLQHEMNQLPVIASDQNPFQPGQPITDDICNSQAGSVLKPSFRVNGKRIRGQPGINIAVACGNNPDLFRTNYPGLGSIQRVESVADSNYNALQFSLRKTSGALTLDVAYTYSHSLDNSSDNFDSNFVNSANLHANYASSNYDQRHILNVAWTYEIPFKGKGFSKALLGGWQYAGIMTAQAGTPFSVVNGVYGDSAGVADGTTGIGSYADRVGDPYGVPICPPLAADTKGVPLYNCGAYVETQGLTFGNSGRNSLRNPRRVNFDMSIFKVFKPIERLNVQFRAEAFNIFNHTEWTGVNPYVSTTNFMYTTGAHMPRVLQFALRLTF
ncbi:MAG TPA: hypothetical protein VNS62_15080, partial [Candidatus Udaeobacter sp.]|nr:hypothetical protein [Candidatus Udaeobacter sp.]